MTASQDSLLVRPTGEAATLVAVVVVLSFFSTVVIFLRIYVRSRIRMFGADDWLMTFGWIFGIAHNAVLLWGALCGLGMPDDQLTKARIIQADMAVFAWEIIYLIAVTFVKASIYAALLRIAEQKTYRIILWAMIALAVVTDTMELLAAIFGCLPISDNWDPTPTSQCSQGGNSTGAHVFIFLEFGVYIALDIACVVMPIFIIWHLRMKTRLKISTAMILGLGSLAAIATIIRLPLTLTFNSAENRLVHRAESAIWATVELNIGLIAGSIPMLQKLFGSLSKNVSSPKNTTGPSSNQFELVTIGQMFGRATPSRIQPEPDEEAVEHEALHEREVESNSDHADSESTRRIIDAAPSQDKTVNAGSI